MPYETIEDWKQEIRNIFKAEAGCSDHFCNVQADAFEEMHSEDWPDVPTPRECFEDELQEWASNC